MGERDYGSAVDPLRPGRRCVMSKEIVHTNEAPRPPASYSQAEKAAGLVFVSGQAILRAAGSSLDQAVSATFILGEEAVPIRP